MPTRRAGHACPRIFYPAEPVPRARNGNVPGRPGISVLISHCTRAPIPRYIGRWGLTIVLAAGGCRLAAGGCRQGLGVGRTRVGETVAAARTARGDTRRTAARRRAVGTRDRIVAHLALVAEITDAAGMASTRLAEAVGYPGSSVAFAQLLSGMERDGLISREVRGKRTYRITLSGPSAARRAAGLASAAPTVPITASPAVAEEPPVPAVFPGAVDYDELADRVILRLLRRVAELDPVELSTLERLLVPGRPRAEELKIV